MSEVAGDLGLSLMYGGIVTGLICGGFYGLYYVYNEFMKMVKKK